MPAYDSSRYRPPAPVAYVALRDFMSGAVLADVPLLIDSGADATLLPAHAIARLATQPLAGVQMQLEGFDGSRRMAPVVALDMLFSDRAFRGEYVVIETEHGVLGRDILAHVRLTLDGPQREWSIDQP
jgi:hypothetical protein